MATSGDVPFQQSDPTIAAFAASLHWNDRAEHEPRDARKDKHMF